jgi:hypothetical protein
MAKASDNPYPSLLVVEGSAPASPAAGNQRVFIDSADHKLKRKNSSGTVTTIEGGGGSGQGLVDFAQAKRTSSDVAINSTTFANVDTALDLVMTASAGDVIECEVVANASKDTSGTTYLVFDFHTIVGGSPVNSVTSETTAGTGLTNSFPGWGSGVMPQNTTRTVFSGTKRYALVSGDISGGTVTLRLRAFCGAASTIKASDPMLYVRAKNLGPQL